jgi:hypothetical protein
MTDRQSVGVHSGVRQNPTNDQLPESRPEGAAQRQQGPTEGQGLGSSQGTTVTPTPKQGQDIGRPQEPPEGAEDTSDVRKGTHGGERDDITRQDENRREPKEPS